MSQGAGNRLALHRGEIETNLGLRPRDGFIDDNRRTRIRAALQRFQSPRQIDLGVEKICEVNHRGAVHLIAHQASLLQRKGHRVFNDRSVDAKNGACLIDQLVERTRAVTVGGELQQHMFNAGPRPQIAGGADAHFHRDRVGALEADALDITCEAIGVLVHGGNRTVAVTFINTKRPGGADAVRHQERHDRPDLL